MAFVEELMSKQRSLPGVAAVAAASATPLGGHWGNFYDVEGAPPKRAGDPRRHHALQDHRIGHDPSNHGAAVAIPVLVAASLTPALRASRVAPASALRLE